MGGRREGRKEEEEGKGVRLDAILPSGERDAKPE